MKTADCTYIFHVIGTLDMSHVRMALESLTFQDPFHWKRFVLFNASDLPSQPILDLVPRSCFEKVEEFEGAKNGLASCTADWLVQMRKIDGTKRYLVHKADFYLPPRVCKDFEDIDKRNHDFIVMFHKFDMKERATPDDIRRYAHMKWKEALADPETGSYGDNLGKLAVSFEQCEGWMDGTMHGYTDSMRARFQPSLSEIHRRWGVADWFRALDYTLGHTVIRDPRFFACHMYHYVPDRVDVLKNIKGERF